MLMSSPLITVEPEIWKSVVNTDGQYEVSNYGRVRSLLNNYRNPRKEPLLLTLQKPPSRRYWFVNLWIKKKLKPRKIHQVVLKAFVGPALGRDGCHKDGNVDNNTLSNLRYDTRTGNMADRQIHGTGVEGSKHGQAKLTEMNVLEIRRRSALGEKNTILAIEFGVSAQVISTIKLRQAWTHI